MVPKMLPTMRPSCWNASAAASTRSFSAPDSNALSSALLARSAKSAIPLVTRPRSGPPAAASLTMAESTWPGTRSSSLKACVEEPRAAPSAPDWPRSRALLRTLRPMALSASEYSSAALRTSGNTALAVRSSALSRPSNNWSCTSRRSLSNAGFMVWSTPTNSRALPESFSSASATAAGSASGSNTALTASLTPVRSSLSVAETACMVRNAETPAVAAGARFAREAPRAATAGSEPAASEPTIPMRAAEETADRAALPREANVSLSLLVSRSVSRAELLAWWSCVMAAIRSRLSTVTLRLISGALRSASLTICVSCAVIVACAPSAFTTRLTTASDAMRSPPHHP